MAEMLVQWSSRLAATLLSGAKARARKRGLAFSLTAEDIDSMWTGRGGCCAVSGIPFNEKRFGDALTAINATAHKAEKIRAGVLAGKLQRAVKCRRCRHFQKRRVLPDLRRCI